MASSDVWGIVLALGAIVAPLALAWGLMAWRDRRREGRHDPTRTGRTDRPTRHPS